MTPEDIDWPPPICDACKFGFHEHCDPIPFCTCLDCPWLYEEAQ